MHTTGPGALLSHTKPSWLSRIPVHIEREDAEKTLHQGDTSAEWGKGPFIVSTVSGGEKGQPEAIPTCSGKAAWGTQAKELTLQGGKASGLGAKWGGQHPLATSSHYSTLHRLHLSGDEKLLPTIHPKVQSLGTLVNK